MLNGSPRKKKTSYAFIHAMQDIAKEFDCGCEYMHIIDYHSGKKTFVQLKEILSSADLIGLVTPFYLDTLPYPVLWFFEATSADLKKELEGKGFFAVGQCGFPDGSLCANLLRICFFLPRKIK